MRICRGEAQTIAHLFLKCSVLKEIRDDVLQCLKLRCAYLDVDSRKRWYSKVMRGKSMLARRRRCLMAAFVYEIWYKRNQRIFQRCKQGAEVIKKKILAAENYF
ncbi:hypothetical protein Droror1_Dr00008961 [Drosera rotundifolia]